MAEKTVRRYVLNYVALMALLALTLGLSFVNLGKASFLVSLTIAIAKALLVAVIFMDLRERGLNRVAAAAGIFWLLVLLSLTFSDYLTRGWLELPGDWPRDRVKDASGIFDRGA